MENDLIKALSDANLKLTDVIKSGKTKNILEHPAFAKLHETLSKFGGGRLSDTNIACDSGCSPAFDRLNKASQPTQ